MEDFDLGKVLIESKFPVLEPIKEKLKTEEEARGRTQRALKEFSLENDPLIFPDIMTGVAGDFARIYSRHLESPKHFFYLSFLTCLGSILSTRLTLNCELLPQPRLS